jgi:hypothetical protein
MVSLALAAALGFSAYLVEQGEPELAILELRRQLDFTPDDAAVRHQLFILDLAQGHRSEARPLARVALERAELAEVEGRDAEALARYREAGARPYLGFVLRRGWWAQAEAAAGALGDRALAGEIAAWRARARLSPDLARGLSLALPGAGQLYAGHPAEAAGALGVNAALVGVAAWAVLRRDWVGAATVLGYGSRYYFGNVLHAGGYVEARLAEEDEAFVARLERDRPWLRFDAG